MENDMKYAYINGKILSGDKDMQVKQGLVIVTEGEKITDIVKEVPKSPDMKVVDLDGRYIMPGLINMHVHLAGNGKPQKKQRDNEKLVKTLMGTALSRAVAYKVVSDFARTELLSGVTTIRTVGGLGDFDTRLRDEIAAGRAVLPANINHPEAEPERESDRVSLQRTREYRFRADIWQARLRWRHTA